jgi:hypothetical protein
MLSTAATQTRNWRSWLSAGGLVALFIATLAQTCTGVAAVASLAWAGAALFVVATWPAVLRQGRWFMAIAVLLGCLCSLLPLVPGTLVKAVGQATSFITLLTAMASMRLPMRRSRLVKRASAWLIARSATTRYASVAFGSHFLSLIFNVGTLQLIGDVVQHAGLRPKEDVPARHLLLAAISGTTTMSLWSPMAMGFAVVTTTLRGLDPLAFIGTGFAIAMVLLLIGCVLPRESREQPFVIDEAGDGSALALLLAGVLVLCATTMATYMLFHIPFILATSMAVPLFSFIWFKLEQHDQPTGLSADEFCETLTSMRTEMFILGASTVIGAAVASAVILMFPTSLNFADGFALIMLCLMAIPLLAALAIPPSVMVILLAQLMANAPLAVHHPLSFALTLLLGWNMGMLVSPVSATLLIASNLAQVSSRTLAFAWNRHYLLATVLIAVISVSVLWFNGL